MWTEVESVSCMPDPRVSLREWFDLAVEHPGEWRQYVRSAATQFRADAMRRDDPACVQECPQCDRTFASCGAS
eukprot:8852130-Alexandrium_andersonii.AAC.1